MNVIALGGVYGIGRTAVTQGLGPETVGPPPPIPTRATGATLVGSVLTFTTTASSAFPTASGSNAIPFATGESKKPGVA